jgi:peptidoglycan lytic transglycosylase
VFKGRVVVASVLSFLVLDAIAEAGTPSKIDYPVSVHDQSVYSDVFDAAGRSQWPRALALAARAKDPTQAKVVEWLSLLAKGSNETFDDYATFIQGNADWPSMDRLRAIAEDKMDGAVPAQRKIEWFQHFPPVSGVGRMKFAEALLTLGHKDEAALWIKLVWANDSLSAQDEAHVVNTFGALLSRQEQQDRLDAMLWEQYRSSSRRAIRRVGADWQALGEARLRLMERDGGVDAAVAQVPSDLKDDPGLAYERARWRRRAGMDDGALDILEKAPSDPSELVRPDRWWKERELQARRLLRAGKYVEAYKLVKNNGLASSEALAAPLSPDQPIKTKYTDDFADAEWMAGWIALTFLKEPSTAYTHFVRMYATVNYPISLARGAYWAGRAAEAMKDSDAAARWYAIAARNPTTFYGQLSVEKQGNSNLFRLPQDPVPTPEERDAFNQRELVQVVRAMGAIGQTQWLKPFFLTLLDRARSASEQAMIADLAREVGRVDLGVRAGKYAVRDGIVLVDIAYPTASFPARVVPEQALLHALSRQESEFNVEAVSPVGARGIMQLMPYTAKRVAGWLDMPYNRDRLTSDMDYNVLLGSSYLQSLLKEFSGSYVLAVAAYNAGEGNVRNWLRLYGDPRAAEVDAVNWIELIPFTETRNYVQRVLESLQVYRFRLGNDRDMNVELSADLNRNVLVESDSAGASGGN